MTTPPKESKCLQINLQHCAAASALLAQIVLELNIDIIFVQEPYFSPYTNSPTNTPNGYRV